MGLCGDEQGSGAEHQGWSWDWGLGPFLAFLLLDTREVPSRREKPSMDSGFAAAPTSWALQTPKL